MVHMERRIPAFLTGSSGQSAIQRDAYGNKGLAGTQTEQRKEAVGVV